MLPWLRTLIHRLARPSLGALLLFACFGLAQAATYTYRSDSYIWETASTAVTWDRACTAYPGDDDQATLNFTGGFVFRFAGVNYSSVRVLSNGALQFGADTGFLRNYTNTTLPAGTATARTGCVATATSRTVMAYWTDLNPSQPGSGNVTWQQKGTAPNRYVVISWNGVYQYNTSTPYTFQIILLENGEFKYQYGNANATGSRATIGVQVDNTDFTLYSFNSGYNANGSAIRWTLASTTPRRLAEYRFDEYSYNGLVGELIDSSGNANNGLTVGTPGSTSTAVVCRALSIAANTSSTQQGADTQVNVNATLGNAGGATFFYRNNAAWTSGPAGMLLDGTGLSSAPFYLQRDANGALRFRVTDSAGAALTATTPVQSIAANTWAHIAISWRVASGSNQTVLRIYVNGSLVATTLGTTTGSLVGSLRSVFVGDARTSTAASGGTLNSANGIVDELRLYNFDIGPAEVALDRSDTHPCVPPVHHLEIEHPSGNSVTCTPTTLTVRACSDAACTTPFTGGVSLGLSATGTPTVVWPSGNVVSIPAGSSSIAVPVQVTQVGSVLISATANTPPATNATTCNFGSPSCTLSAAAAGFLLSVPPHRSDAVSSLTLSAVRQSDSSLACSPAFASTARTVTLSCAYANPSSGSRAVRVGGTALNASNNESAACGSRDISLTFDATGRSVISLQYGDAGRLTLNAQYNGSAGDLNPDLVLLGSTQFIAVPQDFNIVRTDSAALVAGQAFGATATARNANGTSTAAFGNESGAERPSLSWAWSKTAPLGPGTVDGTFTGGALPSSGVATASNLVWSEVGQGTLTVTAANYMGSGLNVVGSLASVGPFRAHHYLLTATPGCGSTHTYVGQPFATAQVTARSAVNTTTLNHAGSWARDVSFSDANGYAGLSFNGGTVLASAFVAGSATTNSLTPVLASSPSGPVSSLRLRVSDALGVTSAAPELEPVLVVKQGRLQLQSATGSSSRTLELPVRLETWSGKSWVLETSDTCTSLTSAQVALSGYASLNPSASAWTSTVVGASLTPGTGLGWVRLSAPSPAGSAGSVALALNLGPSSVDTACLPTPRPSTTGANRAWLRSRWGSAGAGLACAGNWASDPSAKASFGAATLESQRRVHERQVY
jgi:MSHA biogenesis protein MshQ